MNNSELRELTAAEFIKLNLAIAEMDGKLDNVCEKVPVMEKSISDHDDTLYAPRDGIVPRFLVVEDRQKKCQQDSNPALKISRWAIVAAIVMPIVSAILAALATLLIN